MSEEQKAFCDGAAMAYRDCANKVDSLISNAPSGLKSLFDGLRPISVAMRLKAEEVYKQANAMNGARQ